MLGHDFTITEQGWTDPERLLLAACWSVRCLARYTLFTPALTIALPDAAHIALVLLKDLHSKL